MTLDELTQKACDAACKANVSGAAFRDCTRAAVLAVLAEVRQCVPAEKEPGRWESGREWDRATGWNDCRAEMLRRLDAITGGK